MIMGLSLMNRRAEITEEARNAIFQCTLCGGCDVSCKFVSDIEVTEILLALRCESHRRVGPLPAHAPVLQNLEEHGRPFARDQSLTDWLRDAPHVQVGTSPRVLLVGARYSTTPARRATLLNLVRLLDAAGIAYSVLGEVEPDCGTMALALGDRDLFDRLAEKAIATLNADEIQEVVCADAEDFATIRGQFPKVGALRPRVIHAVEILETAVRSGNIRPVHPVQQRVTYHDPCSLGRRSESYQHWEGSVRKIMGQLIIYDPPRPVNRGASGCYDPPRDLLRAIPGLELAEMPRRREFAYCCGAGGGVPEAFPDMARRAAEERLSEAADTGAELLVTACPACESNLASASAGGLLEVASIYDLLARSVLGV